MRITRPKCCGIEEDWNKSNGHRATMVSVPIHLWKILRKDLDLRAYIISCKNLSRATIKSVVYSMNGPKQLVTSANLHNQILFKKKAYFGWMGTLLRCHYILKKSLFGVPLEEGWENHCYIVYFFKNEDGQ